MEGLIESVKELIEEDLASSGKDDALIAAAQKVEHEQIASYGWIRVWAQRLGKPGKTATVKK
jgi:ferritin-like metal-binding protein YciE